MGEILLRSWDIRQCTQPLHVLQSKLARNIISVCRNDTELRKIIRFYRELINYFLKRYATDQEIAKYDGASLLYMQQASMIPQRYTNDLVVKSCKVTDVYDKGTLKDIFIENFVACIHHILRRSREQNPRAGLIETPKP